MKVAHQLIEPEVFREPAGTEMTPQLLADYLAKHSRLVNGRYKPMSNAYQNRYDIWTLNDKPSWKPDNRIPVNFAKYIVDTMNGFFMGIPVKSMSDNEDVSNYLDFLSQYNDMENNNSELSKICSIYGHGYEMYFVDEEGNVGVTYLSPMDAFMIYDESIIERPLYFVRRYVDNNNVEWGSWSDGEVVQHFKHDGSIKWVDEPHIHGFSDVPAAEYLENEERMGIFESALPLIDAYNKAISEKANDVDYFADAYLKILGADLKEEQLDHLRSKRIINFYGADSSGLDVDFLQKPDSDTTQEHLLDRLERLIFQISMIANLSDQDFGTSVSGVSLKYKLQSMYNLAKTKEMKFRSGMNRRYMLIFSNPVSGMAADGWVGITYRFTVNMPANLSDEADTAQKLAGIVSRETQLSILSCVDDVLKEIQKIQEEDEQLKADPVIENYFGGNDE
ncbi:MAG: phage portal protein [Bacteroidales bacterium]|nr:phage portal protein [Bacteroidales bacterium]